MIKWVLILAASVFAAPATIPPVAQTTPFAGIAIGATTGLIVLLSIIFITTNNEIVQ